MTSLQLLLLFATVMAIFALGAASILI